MASYALTEFKYKLRAFLKKWARPVLQMAFAVGLSVGGLKLWINSPGQRLDIWVLKYFYALRGPLPAPEDLVIAAIDDATYKELDASPRWPFPRKYVAAALEQIVAAKPKVLILDAHIPHEENDPAANNRIEAALRAGPTTIWSGELPNSGETVDLVAADNGSPVKLSSDKRFRDAAKMELSMLMKYMFETGTWLTFSARESDTLYDRVPIARPLVELGKYEIKMPGPIDFIKYYGPAGTLHRVPLYKIIGPEKEQIREKFKNKTVFFGYQSIGKGRGQMDKDEYTVPVSDGPMFGIEMHATVAANLIENSWLKRFNPEVEYRIIFFAILLAATLTVALVPEKGILSLFIYLTVSVFIGYKAFSSYNFWIPGLGVLLVSGIFAALMSAFYHYVLIKKFRSYVNEIFNFEMEREI